MAELPPDVQRLLVELGNVEALEVLLLLEGKRGRWWTANQISSTLYMTGSAERSLERLAHLSLVDVRLGNDVSYTYAPTSAELAQTVDTLKEEYDKRRLLVLESLVLVTLSPQSPVRAFAEAFRVFRTGRREND